MTSEGAAGAAGLEALETPAALVHLSRVEANLRRMAELAQGRGLRLRPHAKTHRSPDLGRMQMALGAVGLTVARLVEAEAMAEAGLTDLFLAYPVVGEAKLFRLEQLARRAQVQVGLDSLEVAEGVAAVGRRLGRPLPLYLEVDTGYRRSGTLPGAPTLRLAREVARLEGVTLHGLYTHMGQVYDPGGEVRRPDLARQEGELLVETAELLRREGLPVAEVSIGTTALLPEAADTPGVTELRPGAYIFHDLGTVALGVAPPEACALTVLATVVSRPAPDRLIVDAGHKVLGLARARDAQGRWVHGQAVGAPDLILDRLAEEHGIFTGPGAARWRIGDRLEILPAHAGSVANLAGRLWGVAPGVPPRLLRQVPVGRHE